MHLFSRQYDDVAPDEGEQPAEAASAKQPVRKAPPVPHPQAAAAAAADPPDDATPSGGDAVPPDADEKVDMNLKFELHVLIN